MIAEIQNFIGELYIITISHHNWFKEKDKYILFLIGDGTFTSLKEKGYL